MAGEEGEQARSPLMPTLYRHPLQTLYRPSTEFWSQGYCHLHHQARILQAAETEAVGVFNSAQRHSSILFLMKIISSHYL